MLWMSVMRGFTYPLRRNAFPAPARSSIAARRAVTTDAASSHADRESVPDVSRPFPELTWHDSTEQLALHELW